MEKQAARQKLSPPHRQSGNALIYTLIVIVLLAILGVVLTRGASKSAGNLSDEQARMSAERIMRSAQSFEGGVQKLMQLNACGENDLSFENPSSSRPYTNATAPTDKRCHMFNAAGAGLSYSKPDQTALDISNAAKSDYGHWTFSSGQCVLEVGTGDAAPCTDAQVELMAVFPHISREVCLQINLLLGVTNPAGEPPQEDFDDGAVGFDGTFNAIAGDVELGDTGTGTNLVGFKSGCLYDNAGVWSGSYVFYDALIER
jgi:hypothetical protein